VYDNGIRRTVTLGPWGSPEAEREYARLLAERPAADAQPVGRTVTLNEVLLGFLRWALTHYRCLDGEPTTEIAELKRSVAPVRQLYGHTPAREFGPKALAVVRQHMVERGWCRTLINRRVERVSRGDVGGPGGKVFKFVGKAAGPAGFVIATVVYTAETAEVEQKCERGELTRQQPVRRTERAGHRFSVGHPATSP
jgi:hypothetical protein